MGAHVDESRGQAAHPKGSRVRAPRSWLLASRSRKIAPTSANSQWSTSSGNLQDLAARLVVHDPWADPEGRAARIRAGTAAALAADAPFAGCDAVVLAVATKNSARSISPGWTRRKPSCSTSRRFWTGTGGWPTVGRGRRRRQGAGDAQREKIALSVVGATWRATSKPSRQFGTCDRSGCDKTRRRPRPPPRSWAWPYVTDYRQNRGADVVSVLTPSGLHPRHVSNVADIDGRHPGHLRKTAVADLREAYEVYRRVAKAGKGGAAGLPEPLQSAGGFREGPDRRRPAGKIHQFICNVPWNRNDDYFKIDWHGTSEFDGGVSTRSQATTSTWSTNSSARSNRTRARAGMLRGFECTTAYPPCCAYSRASSAPSTPPWTSTRRTSRRSSR
jgi:hypothetical protein